MSAIRLVFTCCTISLALTMFRESLGMSVNQACVVSAFFGIVLGTVHNKLDKGKK